MKTYFPHYFKKIGILAILIAIALSIAANINELYPGFMNGFLEGFYGNASNIPSSKAEYLKKYKVISDNWVKPLTWISLVFSFAGFLLYMLSKEKIEDEFIQKLRFMSLAKSLLFTWLIYLISQLFKIDVKLQGLYILQFQLFMYVVIFNYYHKWKFAD